jgi:hypothetical protein
MNRLLSLAIALVLGTYTFADPPLPPQDQRQLPPPLPPQELQEQPAPGAGPQLQQPPQNQQPAAAAQPKKAGKPLEFFKARREALAARKQARIDRMRQFQADRAAAEEKLYQDWHERYLADAPVRQEIVRQEAALARNQAAYFYAQPIFVPVYPIYAPIFAPGYQPIYGQFWCGW